MEYQIARKDKYDTGDEDDPGWDHRQGGKDFFRKKSGNRFFSKKN